MELVSLSPLLLKIGLDVTDLGFEPVEIDVLMGDHVDPEADPDDAPSILAAQADQPRWQLMGT